jgi:GNAT superfamily N-acetyltransferase
MNCSIRKAIEKDSNPLLSLIHNHAMYEGSEATVTETALRNILGNGDAPVHLFVAERANKLIGYAALTFDFSLWRAALWAHLDCLFITQAARGSGLGKALLATSIVFAKKAGADRLEWQTPVWNEAAIRFYVREGAVIQNKKRLFLVL